MVIDNSDDFNNAFRSSSINIHQPLKVSWKTQEPVTFNVSVGHTEIQSLIERPNALGIEAEKTEIVFEESTFNNLFHLRRDVEVNLIFINCEFLAIDFSEIRLSSKVKMRGCKISKVNFNNTTFANLIDFYNCYFEEPTVFYKSDFEGKLVLSASHFRKNLLFTYSKLDDELILRNTICKQGIDLSLSIGTGQIRSYGLELQDFKSNFLDAQNAETYEGEYNRQVSETCEIPIENQRETYRILKNNLFQQNNLVEALKYESLEKQTLEKELQKKISRKLRGNYVKNSRSLFNLCSDYVSLILNRWSNNHKQSWLRAFIFTILSGLCFFYPSILSTDKYEFALCVDLETAESAFKHFIVFLSPVHSITYVTDMEGLSPWFFLFDYLGRAIVGYGIYQVVQAFRKLK